MSIFDDPKFEYMDRVAGKQTITLSKSGIGFSKQTLSRLKYSNYVNFYINRIDKIIGIKPCSETDEHDIKFVPQNKKRIDSLRLNNSGFIEDFKNLVGKDLAATGFTCEGEYLEEENALIFDFKKATPLEK